MVNRRDYILPELPEVETTKRGISPFLKNETVVSAVVRNPSLRWPVSAEVDELKNNNVLDVIRRGKYIIIQLDEGSLLIHLGMSGSLRVVDASVPVRKHDHIDIVLGSGKVIRYNDPRRFGCLLWTSIWQNHKLISSLGLEPLSDEFTGEFLFDATRGKRVSVKQFIMNSKIVVGVGNIYANESLFLAGIHPESVVGEVSEERVFELVDVIKSVLCKAIDQGGTTLKDFVGSDGKPGYSQQELHVYGRGGEACNKCDSELIEIKQNNRSSVFCGNCQN